MDGAGADADFGIEAWKPNSTYAQDINRETFVTAQIETPEAVRNVDEIAAVPGIDVLFVGPADLMLRVGVLPESERYTLNDAVALVAAAAKKHGKAWGLPAGTIADCARYKAMGAQFIVRGGDFALAELLKTWSGELDTLEK
jgi:4-hydroxy-2-oxoheptanedioate aldolase